MQVGVLGINFKSAPISTREDVTKACQRQLSWASDAGREYACVVLITCNRVEIYFSAEDLAEAHSHLLHLLREEMTVPFEHTLYSYFGADCFLHLAQVTSGLDSLIVVESEIQRQVKIAYQQTLLYRDLPSCMHYLFQKSLKFGKEVRSSLCFSQSQISIAKVLYTISQQLWKDLSKLPLLFIGNSEINRQVMAYFKRKGARAISLCTRSFSSAQEMAKRENFSLLPWEELSRWEEYPLVIAGSNAPYPLVSSPSPQVATRLIFDLGVPRNVDPMLASHPLLTLRNMEQLSNLIDSCQRRNTLEIHQAEQALFERVQCYVSLFRQKNNRVMVCA
jgi:glutamyl-tRNA reductase